MYRCKYCSFETDIKDEIIEYNNHELFYTCHRCDIIYDSINNLHYKSKKEVLEDELYALQHLETIFEKSKNPIVDYRRMYYQNLKTVEMVSKKNLTSKQKKKLIGKTRKDLSELNKEQFSYKEKLKKSNSYICDYCNHRYQGTSQKIKGTKITQTLCKSCYKDKRKYYENMHKTEQNEQEKKEIKYINLSAQIKEVQHEIDILENFEQYKDLDSSIKLYHSNKLSLSQMTSNLAKYELIRRKQDLKKLVLEYNNITPEETIKNNKMKKSERIERIISQSSEEFPIPKIKFNPIKFKKKLDKLVIGQENPKKQIIMELYKFYNSNSKRNNIFLVGPSGSGKTYTIRKAVELLSAYYNKNKLSINPTNEKYPDELPFLEVDIQQFSAAGYKGREITEMFNPLINRYQGNMEKMAGAVIFIDELDKIATHGVSAHLESSRMSIQQELLKVIEGDKIPFTYNNTTGIIDTNKFLFVCAGAGIGMEEIRKERLSKTTSKMKIGFNSEIEKDNNPINQDTEYITEDFIEYGFIPELLGRIPIICELHPLDFEGWLGFLIENPESPVREAYDICENLGINFQFEESDYSLLAEKCLNNPLGVRGIRKEFLKQFNEQLFESFLNNQELIFKFH